MTNEMAKAMTFDDRIKSGQFMVPVQRNINGAVETKVGDTYLFNFLKYTVNEICTREFDGFCWIGIKS